MSKGGEEGEGSATSEASGQIFIQKKNSKSFLTENEEL